MKKTPINWAEMPLGIMCRVHNSGRRGTLHKTYEQLAYLIMNVSDELHRFDSWKVKLAPAEYQPWLFDIGAIAFLSKDLVDVEDGEKKYQVTGLHPSYRYPTKEECLSPSLTPTVTAVSTAPTRT